MRLRAWLFVVLLLCLYVAADDTTCSATKKCKQGCCNKSGNCGFGPDYCGKSVCRSDCDRKSDCNPGFGKQWAKSDKCPLNVCCSKHGYCGTTKDFCGSKTVKRPSCKKDGDMQRVVGYFEGWAKNRPCEVFSPEQIPIGLYTHINFAFGTINPNTFLIEANDPEDVDMYERLMLLKKKDTNLKIYLAIGGWTFNDPGPTARVFSDLSASPARQRTFFKSVESFLATYKFDGLDLDWEYPVAEERSGREVDYKNFPIFMASLKKVMGTGDKGLTITLPASYWYLQYFDIKKLEPTVDFFNIMSYDLHGAWDQKANWTKPYLNAHTNLTEIDLALDLLWRNDIKSDKVVMGLGFYGRAFTAQSAACRKPGCLFSNPANAGECSQEKGILLNSEIDIEVRNRNLKPELYKEEAVKVVTWGKQWVSYDDADTLKMKVDRAGELCLGGVMVWAISHDTKDARYNKALAKVLGREVTSGSLDDDEKAADFVKKPYEQCRWTNCKEPCPKGWVHVGRSDPGARKNELMYDETACGGDGIHSFCCPPDQDIPICGWWGHGNGKCQKESSCPSGMVEIGTNSMKCEDPPRVQTACCKPNTVSMKLYDTCRWGAYPECNTSPECPGDYYNWPMASSGSGSGALKCNDLKNDLGTPIIGVQMRNYCCNTKPGLRFIDCQVRRDYGPAPDADDLAGYCRSGCPSDRVRVALDTAFHTCTSKLGGGQATCCKTDYSEEVLVPNEKIAVYRKVMDDWVKGGTCPNPDKVLGKRSTTDLVVRDDPIKDITIFLLLRNLITHTGSDVMLAQQVHIWNDGVDAMDEEYLRYTYISTYIRRNWILDWQGPSEIALDILCHPHYWAKRIRAYLTGDSWTKANLMNCKTSFCEKDEDCPLDGGDLSGDNSRRHVTLFGRHAHQLSHSHHHQFIRHSLEERGLDDNKLKFKVPGAPAGENIYEIEVPYNPTLADIKDDDNELLEKVVLIRLRDDCWIPIVTVRKFSKKMLELYKLQMEHLVDKSILRAWYENSVIGKLPSGAASKYGPIPIVFWERINDIDFAVEPGVPNLPGSEDGLFQFQRLFDRTFECLGSGRNYKAFMIVDAEINQAKNYVMRFNRFPAEKSLERYVERDEERSKETIKAEQEKMVKRIRATLSVFWYLATPTAKEKLNKVVKDIHTQLKFAEGVYNKRFPNEKVRLADYFIEWLKDHYEKVVASMRTNVESQIAQTRRLLRGFDDELAKDMRVNMDNFEKNLRGGRNLRIDISGFPKIGDGDTEMGGTS
ncbi:hypothetical protein BFJ63_vAg16191 [Fusarium oxysporum f. sp. narcissi]|uniref:chitinase n=1 Tax=Fusarium oxysporum f. sp. narcissi TaxID=451672 RepID=A0A4Q2V9S0_FUSOX|nr:hypothetical protein BFJ63_vAg16191 [Fusarium oxysporum f. sp. narcissi]